MVFSSSCTRWQGASTVVAYRLDMASVKYDVDWAFLSPLPLFWFVSLSVC